MQLNLLRFWLFVKIFGFLGGFEANFVDLVICSAVWMTDNGQLRFAAIFIIDCFMPCFFGEIEAY